MSAEQSSQVVAARAPGKVNLFLSVGAVMEDGYHDVATAYQAVSLYEDVHAYPADDFSVSFSGRINTSTVPTDGSNLAIKAARLLARKTGYRGGVRLEIEKNVPVAGGMGGGSADAAATLLACDALWGTGLTREDLVRLAAKLGADVPFALVGGTALGSGRGDRLSPALTTGNFTWVFALAEQGLSTPAVYRRLDEHREKHALDISPASTVPQVDPNVLQAIRAGDAAMLADSMHNDMQVAALQMQPGLSSVIELGERSGALAGIVSGSGPTVAFLASDVDSALEIQVSLSANGIRTVRAQGPVSGARLITE
ncbi:4-(cytidine 5'-diphospho)-2-C-methyl-D-erythritol kinase [Mycetocola spongiae]|uniref:4-(cytidine 5'-diphospho)-2-C-methyl-D-erythritol kinase n=1 Tax=Mycetocola spongiae TaxID=2859226 RepID=UPI001CF43368|nr:4-(cytidine 5'-diphospho)-2-C-methyl-D-erythritol kinase [Mycetocola spongiae]UCR88929.1 4-(cytidine 5'-diphospho)-2-C-methyl-D-erythritol kinase [Mycetocola spongiae]